MVIQTETYPGFSYQQQSYVMVHETPYFSPPNHHGQYSPSPYTATPYPMPHAAYPQQPSGGWYDTNKQQPTGWQSTAAGGWTSDTNKHQNTGWQSPTHGGWNSDINKHQSTGWQGTTPGGWNSTGTDYYSHGSNGQMPAYNYNDGYKVNGDYGYGSYQGAHVPGKIEQSSCEGRVRCPCHGSSGMHNGYEKAEWKLKSIED